MTIEIAVRTASDVIFAADSKLTTNSFAGLDRKGKPQFLVQTYDNATKLTHDLDKTFIACVAGNPSFGAVSIIDFLAERTGGTNCHSEASQDDYFAKIIYEIGNIRAQLWGQFNIPFKDWPITIILIATISPSNREPRLWRVAYVGDSVSVTPILLYPNVYLEGSYYEVFSLLYGYHPQVVEQTKRSKKAVRRALSNRAVIKPLDRLNVEAMPVQDAMDLAYFLAGVQIEMDKFLPGTPRCGWPVDLMVLQGKPFRTIREFPGKQLMHPKNSSVAR